MFQKLLLISLSFFNFYSSTSEPSNKCILEKELFRNYNEEIKTLFNISESTSSLILFNNSYTMVYTKKEPSASIVNDFECLEWDKQFCIKMSNYPKLDKFTELFERKYPQLKMFTDKNHVEDEIEKRMLSYKETSCRSRDRIIYPTAMHTNFGLLFIVNNENYKQELRIEECESEDDECIYEPSNLPEGFIATCKQNFIYKVLVVMTEYGDVITHRAEVPSCCKCVIKDFGKNAKL